MQRREVGMQPLHTSCPRPERIDNNEVCVAGGKHRSIDLHGLPHQSSHLGSSKVPAGRAVEEVERAVISIEKRRAELLIWEVLQTVVNGCVRRALREMAERFNENPSHYYLGSGRMAMSRVALGCE